MGDEFQRRACDFIAGAAGAGVVVGLAAGSWRGALVMVGAVVFAQGIRPGL